MQWPTKEFIPFVLSISTVKKCPSLFFHASFTWETAFYTCFITQPNVLQKPTLDTYLHPSVFLIINYKTEQVEQEYYVFYRGEKTFQLKNKKTLENKINTNCPLSLNCPYSPFNNKSIVIRLQQIRQKLMLLVLVIRKMPYYVISDFDDIH